MCIKLSQLCTFKGMNFSIYKNPLHDTLSHKNDHILVCTIHQISHLLFVHWLGALGFLKNVNKLFFMFLFSRSFLNTIISSNFKHLYFFYTCQRGGGGALYRCHVHTKFSSGDTHLFLNQLKTNYFINYKYGL